MDTVFSDLVSLHAKAHKSLVRWAAQAVLRLTCRFSSFITKHESTQMGVNVLSSASSLIDVRYAALRFGRIVTRPHDKFSENATNEILLLLFSSAQTSFSLEYNGGIRSNRHASDVAGCLLETLPQCGRLQVPSRLSKSPFRPYFSVRSEAILCKNPDWKLWRFRSFVHQGNENKKAVFSPMILFSLCFLGLISLDSVATPKRKSWLRSQAIIAHGTYLSQLEFITWANMSRRIRFADKASRLLFDSPPNIARRALPDSLLMRHRGRNDSACAATRKCYVALVRFKHIERYRETNL